MYKLTLVCGNCYGAGSSTRPCCNSCNEVIQAYKEKNWSYNIADFRQCDNETNIGMFCNLFVLIYVYIAQMEL